VAAADASPSKQLSIELAGSSGSAQACNRLQLHIDVLT
jgi:hypothetical protein